MALKYTIEKLQQMDFGKLKVIAEADSYVSPSGQNLRKVKVLCSCGTQKDMMLANLLRVSRSCGKCPDKGEGYKTHGHSHTPTYNTYYHMIARCLHPSCDTYSYYGGRGITVCDRWLPTEDRQGFFNFKEDMGDRPKGKTLDRIDVNKGYSPENCRWTDGSVQTHNRRKSKGDTSKYIGVCKPANKDKFIATIKHGSRQQTIGWFADEYEAAVAYDNKSEELYGDRPNKTVRT